MHGKWATLSGKHDRANDADATTPPQTGPVLSRFLGRRPRETFLLGRLGRHRAIGAGAVRASRDCSDGALGTSTTLVAHGERNHDTVGDNVTRAEAPSGDSVVVDSRQYPRAETGVPELPELPDEAAPKSGRLQASTDAASSAEMLQVARGGTTAITSTASPRGARAVGSPRRGRVGRPGPETIGIVVLVVLAVVCVLMIGAVVQKTRSSSAIAAREAADYTPPPLSTSATPVVAVIGDDTTTRAASGVSASKRWTALTAIAQRVSVRTFAASGSGYVTATKGRTFVQQAAKVPVKSQVVVFFGGGHDAGKVVLSVARAATKAFAAARKRAPNATIVVIGPAIDGSGTGAQRSALRDVLHSSAQIANAIWVDPIDARWLGPATIASKSGRELSASDERALAVRISSEIASARE